MLTVAFRGVHLRHIRVNPYPLLTATWLYKHLVVIFQRSILGSRIGEYLMQLNSFFDTRHSHLTALPFALRLALQRQYLLCVWHLLPLHLHIMVVGLLVNVPQLATSHLSRFRPVAVKSRQVLPRLEGNTITQIIASRVLKAFHQAVIECAPQIIALRPRHLADVGHCL